MKRLILLMCALALVLLAACATPAEDMELSETEGRLLLSANGTAILVTEDSMPMVLSIQADGDAPFDGFLLEEGSLEDVPKETLTALEELGWNFCQDAHAPAAESQTVADPVTGYCGNTITTVNLDGETYSFWGSDSVMLTDILINLDYAPGAVCRCLPEFTVDTEFGSGYGVNLTETYARCEAGQAPLTVEQAEAIRGILERNCE